MKRREKRQTKEGIRGGREREREVLREKNKEGTTELVEEARERDYLQRFTVSPTRFSRFRDGHTAAAGSRGKKIDERAADIDRARRRRRERRGR